MMEQMYSVDEYYRYHYQLALLKVLFHLMIQSLLKGLVGLPSIGSILN